MIVTKNHGLRLGHCFCAQGHAARNYYLFAQMAHIVLQLAALSDILKHWRKKQPTEAATPVDTLLRLFGSLKFIIDRIRLELFGKPMELHEFPNLRVRLPTG